MKESTTVTLSYYKVHLSNNMSLICLTSLAPNDPPLNVTVDPTE